MTDNYWPQDQRDIEARERPDGDYVLYADIATPAEIAPPDSATLTLQEAIAQEVNLILTDEGSTLSLGAIRALNYIDRVVNIARPAPEALPSAAKRLIGWRTENYLWETSDIAMAQNWEPHIGVLPIFEGDPHTKLSAPEALGAAKGVTVYECIEAMNAMLDDVGRASSLPSAVKARAILAKAKGEQS